jgi:hypothetical protein
MKKLYLATKKIQPKTQNVMFVYDERNNNCSLNSAAQRYFEQEEYYHCMSVSKEELSISEISFINDVPKEWQDAILWGIDEEISPAGFLSNIDPEYKEYLRLKAKFEK